MASAVGSAGAFSLFFCPTLCRTDEGPQTRQIRQIRQVFRPASRTAPARCGAIPGSLASLASLANLKTCQPARPSGGDGSGARRPRLRPEPEHRLSSSAVVKLVSCERSTETRRSDVPPTLKGTPPTLFPLIGVVAIQYLYEASASVASIADSGTSTDAWQLCHHLLQNDYFAFAKNSTDTPRLARFSETRAVAASCT